MDIKEMKDKIYSLLDIGKLEDESLLISAIESAARKIALYTKCIRKNAKILILIFWFRFFIYKKFSTFVLFHFLPAILV